MAFATKSERELRRFLRSLSSKQIKKLVDGIDVSPFPVLLASEYRRRFGYDESMTAKAITMVRRQLRQEHKKQMTALDKIRKDMAVLKSCTISDSGIAGLSETSVSQIQNRRIRAVENLRRSYKTLYTSLKKIERLENEYLTLVEKD